MACRYTGLVMMSKLGAQTLSKNVQACHPPRGMLCPAVSGAATRAGVLVSSKEGAWVFGDPQPALEDVPDDGCVWQAVPDFAFRLYRRGRSTLMGASDGDGGGA
jgi:hypothetical protein